MNKVICHIVQHLRPGGLETMVLALKKYHSQNNQVYIISIEGSREESLQNWPILHHEDNLYFLNKPQRLSLACLRKIQKILKEIQCDVIHLHHIGPLLYGGLATLLHEHYKVIYTEHAVDHFEKKKYIFLARMLFKLIQPKVIADTLFVKDYLQENHITHNIKVIYNGIDVDRFKPQNRIEAKAKFNLSKENTWVGIAARLNPIKGIPDLIHAIALLPDKFCLLIAGSGPEVKNYQSLIQNLNLESRIILLGNLDDIEIFYNAIDIFCLSSLCEGMPMSLLEAASCDLPIVATQVGGIPEFVCSKVGQLSPKQDPEKLSQAILSVAKRNDFQNRSHIEKSSFTLQHMAEEYEKVYEELV